MINLRQYLEVLKPSYKLDDDYENQRDESAEFEGIMIGYLTRVLYNKQEGIEKAMEEATKYVRENWTSIVNDWNNDLEYKQEEEKKDSYESLTKLYE